MSLTANAALIILEGRYDYRSARVILKAAAARAGLPAAGSFEPAALAEAVLDVGDRVDEVVAALRACAPKPATAPTPEVTPEAPGSAAETDAAEETASDEDAPSDEVPASRGRRRRSKR